LWPRIRRKKDNGRNRTLAQYRAFGEDFLKEPEFAQNLSDATDPQ
jgi:hypothetical protein